MTAQENNCVEYDVNGMENERDTTTQNQQETSKHKQCFILIVYTSFSFLSMFTSISYQTLEMRCEANLLKIKKKY